MNHRPLTRAFFAAFVTPECFPAEPAMIPLPSPKKAGSMGVESALATRRSLRAHTTEALLEAVALRLGAVVTGGINPASVKEVVKFTSGEEVMVVIRVGHRTR